MRRVLLLLALAACQHGDGTTPSCPSTYQHLGNVGAWGGAGYGGPGAVAFGLACAKLAPADASCLASAGDAAGIARCAQPAQDAVAVHALAGVKDAPAVNAQQITAVVNGLCACKDAACLVEFASRHRDAVFGVLGSGDHDGLTRLGECLIAVKP